MVINYVIETRARKVEKKLNLKVLCAKKGTKEATAAETEESDGNEDINETKPYIVVHWLTSDKAQDLQ